MSIKAILKCSEARSADPAERTDEGAKSGRSDEGERVEGHYRRWGARFGGAECGEDGKGGGEGIKAGSWVYREEYWSICGKRNRLDGGERKMRGGGELRGVLKFRGAPTGCLVTWEAQRGLDWRELRRNDDSFFSYTLRHHHNTFALHSSPSSHSSFYLPLHYIASTLAIPITALVPRISPRFSLLTASPSLSPLYHYQLRSFS